MVFRTGYYKGKFSYPFHPLIKNQNNGDLNRICPESNILCVNANKAENVFFFSSSSFRIKEAL